ncbi:MAG TPA: hypothetical protein VND95_15010 [Stellaceae bacterium]|nr:hypothetical protein [Stellaceae bacterium]
MRAIFAAALGLVAIAAGAASARSFDAPNWYKRGEAWVHSLLGAPPADHDIIAPAPGIDPQMAVVPPQSRGTMRIIAPPAASRR